MNKILKYTEVKETFNKMLKENFSIEDMEREFIHMRMENVSDSIKYTKAFFAVIKDIDLKLAIKYGEEVLKEEEDPKFMKVLAVRYKRIGKDAKYNTLMGKKIPITMLKIKLDQYANEKVSFDVIDNYIKLFIDKFPELELETYKVAFSKLKDLYTEEAIKYGEEVIKKEQDPKFIKVLASRYKKIGDLKKYGILKNMEF